MNKIELLSVMCIAALCSCNSTPKQAETENISAVEYQTVENFVDTMTLSKGIFNRQIVCNGKLRAIAKSNLSFDKSGIVTQINVRNGSLVEKGDLLAMTDIKEAEIELTKAHGQMDKVRIDLVDQLIGQGYDADTSKVPSAIMKRVRITSGYNSAQEQLEAAKRNLRSCYLYSPFKGRVANMESKIHQRSKELFCTLIDDSAFDVEFNLLEAEMDQTKVGQRVIVTPFVDDSKRFTGTVTQVNPMIDDKGQIKICAEVFNSNGYLIEGMNVKIIIENAIGNQFVVPKDAVVLRDGYSVIFRYINGEASWTYVDVLMSNIDSHVITGNKQKETSISENDIVITSGNINLADGTKVSPKSAK